MGWTFTHKPKTVSVADFFKSEWTDCTFHAIKVVNMRTAYMACSHNKRPGEIFAVICLLDYKPKDHFNFGYKDMDETMGPWADECPVSIINLLTPTDNVQAIKWRGACLKKINEAKSKPKIALNSIIKFEKGVGPFGNGQYIDAFKVVSMRPLEFCRYDLNINRITENGFYRLPKWVFKNNSYTVTLSK